LCVTSDGGLILVRELDKRLGFGELIGQHLTDSRRGKNTQLPLADLLRQSVYSRIAGYEDLNDAERLRQDPMYLLIGSERLWDRGAALLPSVPLEPSPAGIKPVGLQLGESVAAAGTAAED
jgi:Transposase DDE domain group 1